VAKERPLLKLEMMAARKVKAKPVLFLFLLVDIFGTGSV
jgi:hypothetical protein